MVTHTEGKLGDGTGVESLVGTKVPQRQFSNRRPDETPFGASRQNDSLINAEEAASYGT